MGHLVFNFHYVGMPAMPHPGIHGLDVAGFAERLKQLASRYAMVSLEQVEAAAHGGDQLPPDACLITFDDGLKCQYDVAMPILDDLKIPAALFMLGCPYADRRAATVHKLHFVRGSLGDGAVIAEIEAITARGQCHRSMAEVDIAVARDSYRYDSEESARLKYFLNYMMDAEFTETLVDACLARAGMAEDALVDLFYMTPDMIAALGRRGMVGSHAMSHRPLSQMPSERAQEELAGSRKLLSQICGREITAVSYPLGSATAVNRDVAQMAADAGYTLGWTMERARNTGFADPLLFARLDASDNIAPDAIPVRSRYTQEAA